MSYKVKHVSGRMFEIRLDNEPEYCVPLTMAPARREPQLDQGAWLVMVVAVWSGPDYVAVGDALTAAKTFDGFVRLGIRPFEEFSEMETWCCNVREGDSPVWVSIKDGAIVDVRAGPVSIDTIAQMMEQLVG
jgi:hypothetical protein